MKLSDQFSVSLIELLKKINNAQYDLCLVGGAVRDFLKSGKLNNDLDFELRSIKTTSHEGHLLQELISLLREEKVNYELLPYSIVKFSFEDFNLEFSPPRVEKFIEGAKSHHNFSANLDFNLNYSAAFLRRDFTINSIGLELRFENESLIEILVDPFDGVTDLRQDCLKSKNPDFYKDPVRLLRLIRFSIQFQMEIDREITSNLSKFDLSEISYFHFWREASKVDVGKFLNLFSGIISANHIPLDQALCDSLLPPFPEDKIFSLKDLVAFTYFKSSDKALSLSRICAISDKYVKKMINFFGHYNHLIDDFSRIKKDASIYQANNSKVYLYKKSLLYVDQNREFINYMGFSDRPNIKLPFDISQLDEIRIESSEIASTRPEDRSLLKYTKFLSKILGRNDDSN